MQDPCWLALLHFVKDNGACCGSPMPDLPPLPPSPLAAKAMIIGAAAAAPTVVVPVVPGWSAAPTLPLSKAAAVSSWMIQSSELGSRDDSDGEGDASSPRHGGVDSTALLTADMKQYSPCPPPLKQFLTDTKDLPLGPLMMEALTVRI